MASLKDKAPKKEDSSALEITIPDGFATFMTPIALLVSALIISGAILYSGSRNTADDTGDTTEDVAGTEDTPDTTGTETNLPDVVRTYETFTEYDNALCEQGGKPVIYLFSTTWCPHCTWIKETFDAWARANSSKAAIYHWEVDTNDNTLTKEVETEVPADATAIYEKFNPSQTIPTFVFGCRYARVGNGFESETDSSGTELSDEDKLELEQASFDKVLKELL